MNAVKIDDRLTVASQPDPASFGKLAAEGYAAVVNARPDGEEPSQPGNQAEKAAAKAAGLAYAFIPVTGPASPRPTSGPSSRRSPRRTARCLRTARAACAR